MREHKYRAWDKDANIMWPDVGILPEDTPYDISMIKETQKPIFNPKTTNVFLMQFAGLKDINKVEIYEKDIIRANKAMPRFYGFNSYKGIGGLYVMEFIEGAFTFIRGQHITQDTITFWGLEVVGNIYENSDLFKEAK